MKKITLAFDSTHFSEGAFEFACRLNKLQPVLLTGVFLPQSDFANAWSYADGACAIFIPLIGPEESELEKENIERFEMLCRHNNIDYRVHKDFSGSALPELVKESRFTDLLMLSSEIFYNGTKSPNFFLREALHNVTCPVLLVPEKFEFPESIILAYDGSENSAFAIKQFVYLFPELTTKKTVLVYANDDAEDDFPDKIQIEELVARHFKDLTFFKMDYYPDKYFSTWIAEKKSAMLVCGSYGRSGVSQLFKKSFVRGLIGGHRLPVFIAHK